MRLWDEELHRGFERTSTAEKYDFEEESGGKEPLDRNLLSNVKSSNRPFMFNEISRFESTQACREVPQPAIRIAEQSSISKFISC